LLIKKNLSVEIKIIKLGEKIPQMIIPRRFVVAELLSLWINRFSYLQHVKIFSIAKSFGL